MGTNICLMLQAACSLISPWACGRLWWAWGSKIQVIISCSRIARTRRMLRLLRLQLGVNTARFSDSFVVCVLEVDTIRLLSRPVVRAINDACFVSRSLDFSRVTPIHAQLCKCYFVRTKSKKLMQYWQQKKPRRCCHLLNKVGNINRSSDIPYNYCRPTVNREIVTQIPLPLQA